MSEVRGFSYYIQGKTKILVRIFKGSRVEGQKNQEAEGFVINLKDLDLVDGVIKKSSLLYGEKFGDNRK